MRSHSAGELSSSTVLSVGALFQAQEAVEHLEGDEVPGDAGRRQLLVAQELEVVAQLAEAGCR